MPARRSADRTPTLRESMVLHRSRPSCASCHDRMDPLGLALENFNALGRWRDKERGQPIDASGKLITGRIVQGRAGAEADPGRRIAATSIAA